MGAHVVAMFGISGVGKTTLAAAVVATMPSITHLTASALLRDENQQSNDELRRTDAGTIGANQAALVRAFLRQADRHAHILFDGHSLIDTDATLIDIPTEVILALKPEHIVFVVANPHDISERRRLDPLRARPERSRAELQAQQERALANASEYARVAKIGITLVSANDIETVCSLFRSGMQ